MPGIEDLMNIRTQGGTENAPMPPPGMPPQGGAPMGPPPQAGPPPTMPPMGGPPMGGPPAMPPDMGGAEQAPPSIEEDAASLAEAVIGRAGGDPQAAVAILDTAAQMIMQSTEGEGAPMPPPQGMQGGGVIGRNIMNPRTIGAAAMRRKAPPPRPFQRSPRLGIDTGPSDRPEFQQAQGTPMRLNEEYQGLQSHVSPPPSVPDYMFPPTPRGGKDGGYVGMNMGGGIYPQYANEGKYLEDEADELRQMIMEGSRAGAAAAEAEGRDPRFRDYQPEGSLKGTLFDYVPDPIQLSSFLMDRFGRQEDSPMKDRLQEFFDAYEKDPDAFSKDAIEADAVEEERRKAAQRAAAYRSR